MSNRTVTVKPSGGDYTSLQSAVTGEATDLVTPDEHLFINCYNMLDTTAVNFSSGAAWTTDATHFPTITAVDNHGGIWGGAGGTSSYRLQVSINAWVIDSGGVAHLAIIGLSVSNVNQNGGFLCQGCGVNYDRVISRVEGTNTTSNSMCFYTDQTVAFGLTASAKSCIAINRGSGGGWGFYCPDNITLENCTAYLTNNGDAYHYNAHNVLKNCIAATSGTCFVQASPGAGGAFLICCAGQDGTANSSTGLDTGSATGCRVNQTFTFVNTGTDDLHLATNDAGARGFGTPLTGDGVTVDVNSNPIGFIWSIGADQPTVPVASTLATAYEPVSNLGQWADAAMDLAGWFDPQMFGVLNDEGAFSLPPGMDESRNVTIFS